MKQTLPNRSEILVEGGQLFIAILSGHFLGHVLVVDLMAQRPPTISMGSNVVVCLRLDLVLRNLCRHQADKTTKPIKNALPTSFDEPTK